MPDITEAGGSARLGGGLDTGELDRTDRILLGACAAVWLVALGAGVAATVALVDLGTAHARSTGKSETPWLLYVVIAMASPPSTSASSVGLQAWWLPTNRRAGTPSVLAVVSTWSASCRVGAA